MPTINPWPWLALLLVLGGLYGAHRYVVYDAVKQNTVQIEQRYQKAADQAEATAKEASRLLKMSNDRDIQTKDNTISAVRSDLERANRLLRDRPKRPTGQAVSPQSSTSCTGRELYQEDGLFLRGEAARAEEVVIERDYYYNRYLQLEETINGR